jgi:hypothetical protein
MYPALHRMETSLMTFGRKAAIAVAAFATVGSTLFGGAALAGDDWNGHGHGKGGHPGKDDKKVVKVDKKHVDVDHATSGDTGRGGDNNGDNCSKNFLPVLNNLSLNVALWGDAKAANCNQTAGDSGDSGDAATN